MQGRDRDSDSSFPASGRRLGRDLARAAATAFGIEVLKFACQWRQTGISGLREQYYKRHRLIQSRVRGRGRFATIQVEQSVVVPFSVGGPPAGRPNPPGAGARAPSSPLSRPRWQRHGTPQGNPGGATCSAREPELPGSGHCQDPAHRSTRTATGSGKLAQHSPRGHSQFRCQWRAAGGGPPHD